LLPIPAALNIKTTETKQCLHMDVPLRYAGVCSCADWLRSDTPASSKQGGDTLISRCQQTGLRAKTVGKFAS
jgi:hypothetical protein